MDTADKSQWNRLDDVFSAALELPEDAREEWLQHELASTPDVLRRATQLLKRERDSRSRFEGLHTLRAAMLDEVSTDIEGFSEDPRIGARYGPWRILRRLAVGGLSVVYEANRDDGRYEQTVALKVMRGGVQNGEAIRHFLRERRILSTLDHPGIVRILDGGETATGAPWLAMDMAPGRPITAYCREAGLDLHSRLALVADVADATQSAHSKLIVHRDIKPDNIIVSDDGRARLLDFGVSSLAGSLGDPDGTTAMTPDYASPEQLRLEQVTTASDIYQLGRVLSELCTGLALPAGTQAVIRKAMAQAPEDRYPSAASFANDIRAVLGGRAPAARPDTRTEAAYRFVRHNRAASGLAALLILGAVGWGVMLSAHGRALESERANAIAEADRADRGKSVLLDLFRRIDPLELDGVKSNVGDAASILEPTLDDVRERLTDDPELQAELIGWVARSKERSDNLKEARELADEAVSLLKASGASRSSQYAAALAYRARLDIQLGEDDQSADQIEEALSIARAAPQGDLSALDTFLTAAWSHPGEWVKQRVLFEEALPRALAAGSTNGEIEARSGLGRAFGELGRLSEAEEQIRASIALTESTYGPDHPRLALPLSDLGRILGDLGDHDAAIGTQRRALALSTRAFGPLNSSTLSHQNNLANALSSAKSYDEAITLYETILASRISLSGEGDLEVGDVHQNLAVTQVQAGLPQDALASLMKAEAIFDDKLPAGHPRRAYPALTRSAILLDLHRYTEAERNARYAFDALSQSLPPGHFATEVARCRVGLARLGLGDRAGARAYLDAALRALETQTAAPSNYVAPCKSAGRELGLDVQP
ncbi:serine/threonine-protein kinase [Hyphomonas johnsonii]|uniref:Serine/threonine protein kinase n=1 Tax=Hyphomonas johnsonii MHS-2 TaxID=1280950 RepID=A0A059FU42_9PROT|nr:serine/threonine-protein kinase [Hyphomonas johnsonii]KCZ94107.1 serine/threonine protein kinase [Hyphomonas johnsonii MHS-2]